MGSLNEIEKVIDVLLEEENENYKRDIEDVKGLYYINCYTYSVKNDKLIFNPLED